ncbi:MAG: hypothetical protein U0802_21260 [Candidatus Binatia bacterium]
MVKGITIHACATLTAALLASEASGGPSPEAKCQASKLTITANYSAD